MEKPLVSIIMPSYNSSLYIAESIESVISQSYSRWELLITDDCSSDDTVEIINRYMKNDSRIKLFANSQNSGAGISRNRSISESSGRFIAFLDSDDYWAEHKLERQISFMLKNEAALSYTAYQKVKDDKLDGVVNPPSETDYNGLLNSNVIGCLTAIYDTQVLGKRYMPSIRKRQDLGLWLDILRDIPKAYCLNDVLAYYRVDSGMTSNKLAILKWQWRFYRDVVKLGFFESIYRFFMYSINGFIKYSR